MTASETNMVATVLEGLTTALTQLSYECVPLPYPSDFSLDLSNSFKSEDILRFYKPPPDIVLKNLKNPTTK